MRLSDRIMCFSQLGEILRDALEGKGEYAGRIESLINRQQFINPWFTPENVRMALKSVAVNLTMDKLREWTGRYPGLNLNYKPVKVGVIMAGNIPLVGFHDFLCVLMTGNRVIARTSSKDPELPVAMAEILYDIDDEFRNLIEFSDGIIKDFDAVIATGSNNTSRYFKYYFGKYHSLIRKNRNSVAIITGNEEESELERLGEDIFSYFGLGCRNVSKLFIPEYFDPDSLRKYWEKYSGLINHTKYGNNYDYYKAVYLVNKEAFRDSGFYLMKEDRDYASPVSVIYYEYYRRDEDFSFLFGPEKEKLQCIVGRGLVEFGKSQWPELWDYADDTDTVEFILKKNLEETL